MYIILGIICIALGTLVTIKSEWLVQNFGHSSWAESKMGMWGGTRLMIKMIGMAMIIFGLLLATGLLANVIRGIIPKSFLGDDMPLMG